jgi:hypothetical protein
MRVAAASTGALERAPVGWCFDAKSSVEFMLRKHWRANVKYRKCRWDEPRAEPYGAWGCSWWFFEFGPDGTLTRQVEVYDNGVRLRYGPDHLADKFGKRGAARLQDMEMPGAQVLTAEEFETVWESVKSNTMVD